MAQRVSFARSGIPGSGAGRVTAPLRVDQSVVGARLLGKVPSLDGMRAVAVLVVMAFHADVPGFLGGRAGVDVFFVLSGFLITTLLLQEKGSSGHIRLGAFYMRRILRLYPALIAAVLLAIVLAALKVPIFDASTLSLTTTVKASPLALFYTMNIGRAAGWTGGGFLGHTWSLAIEEQFYLVWPLIVIVVMRRRSSPVLLGWLALACALTSAGVRAALTLAGFSEEMLYNATFSHVDGIFLGCAAAVLWLARPELLARCAGPWKALAAVSVAAVLVIHGQNMNTYGFLLIGIASVVVLADVLYRRESTMSRALSHPAAVSVGRRSYGLYLYHWPIFLFIGIDTRPMIVMLGFGMSFAAAWVSFALIEQPFLRMKGRWASANP